MLKPRLFALLAAVSMVVSACARDNASGPQSRTVLIDYKHDEFTGIFLAYFPHTITVRPGDTVEFKQAWSGEPHSVTMGTMVDKGLGAALKLFKEKGPDVEFEEPPEYKALPLMLGDPTDADPVHQNGAQPCYLETGTPPSDVDKACPRRKQPPFNGRQTYYNSGFIPFEGIGGNKFAVELSKDIKPGQYLYYCNLHGGGMNGAIRVEPKSSSIPSQAAVDKTARRELEKMSGPLLKTFRAATNRTPSFRKKLAQFGMSPKENLSGLFDEKVEEAGIAEFIPKTIKAKTGEKVTWRFLGGHTISFNVPRYFAIANIGDDGKVRADPKAFKPVGGWPGPPKEDESAPLGPGEKPKPTIVDAGKWNGTGFRSSGLFFSGGDQGYSVTFTKPGTYEYACLIHPEMVGKVEVR